MTRISTLATATMSLLVLALVSHGACAQTGGGTQVEKSSVPSSVSRDEIDQDPMTAPFEVLEIVDVRHGGAANAISNRQSAFPSNRPPERRCGPR